MRFCVIMDSSTAELIMGIKAENTQRIRELEAEFSDERIAEHFHVNGVDDMNGRSVRARRMRKAALRGILVFVIVVVCLIAALQFFLPEIVQNTSMENTIIKTDCVIVAKHAYDSAEAGPGDIIAHGPYALGEDGGTQSLINRIIGIPGDRIEIRKGNVYRNGERLDEPYIEGGGAGAALPELTVPEGCYFVLGDNRLDSVDSRDDRVGFVLEADIRGKVVFRLLPVSRAGRLS